jgi:hypothetical protein
MADSVVFSRLMDEYGNLEADADPSKSRAKGKVKKDAAVDDSTEEGGPKKDNAALMQTEERNTGAVTWTVYKKYLVFAGGMIWAPIIVLLLTLTQAAQGVFCSWHLHILGSFILSWQQSIPWILDLAEHPWLQARRLYGGLCQFGYISLSLSTQIFSNPSVRCRAGCFYVLSQLFLCVSLTVAI